MGRRSGMTPEAARGASGIRLALPRLGVERQHERAVALDHRVAAVGVETKRGVVVILSLQDQPQCARRDCSRSDGSEEGATNSEPSVCRQDEQVSDLPEVGEPQRRRNLHRGREPDESLIVFSDEHAETTRTEVLAQPAR